MCQYITRWFHCEFTNMPHETIQFIITWLSQRQWWQVVKQRNINTQLLSEKAVSRVRQYPCQDWTSGPLWIMVLSSVQENPDVISPQRCPFLWRIWSPSNTQFLGSTRVHNSNGISIDSAIFAELMVVTESDRPSNRPCYSICSNRWNVA